MIVPFVFILLQTSCTWTKDAKNNVILSSGCTAAIIFMNANAANFHLMPGSPAIGNAVCLPEVTTDFDGVPRPNRAPNTYFQGDTGCDIGAYQFVVPNPPPAAPKNLRIIRT
jgi:hypothetical protein